MNLDDDLLARLARNCAGAYVTPARAMDKPWRTWEDAWVVDFQMTVPVPPNGVNLIRPLEAGGVADLVDRIDTFYTEREGGGIELWSIWPTPDLSDHRFEDSSCPCMVREAGGEAPTRPSELRIVEADDAASLRDVERAAIEGFRIPGMGPGDLFDPRALAPEYRMWVGYVDGRPVSTACAYIAEGFVGVYAVATVPEARGRGYGEALSWAATLCRPDLPSTLQASEMGQPVYERMGYRTVTAFTVWERAQR